MIVCDDCGALMPVDRVHEFENGAGRTVGRVCRACCPRCDVVARVPVVSVP